MQRSLGNRAVGGLVARAGRPGRGLRSSALDSASGPPASPAIQRMKIEFPPRLKINPINTEDKNVTAEIEKLSGNQDALEVIRQSLAFKQPLGLEPHEQQVYQQVLLLLNPQKSPTDKTVSTQSTSNDTPDAFTQFGLPNDVLLLILSYFETTDLLNTRLISQKFGSLVMAEAGRRIPYPDKTIFSLLNHRVFPNEFAKGNFTKAPIGKEKNVEYAWEQYKQTQAGKINLALVMRIFETNTFRKLNAKQAEGFENEQVIFRPATSAMWTPQIDDAWILGHIHKHSTFLIMCDPSNIDNFWDRKDKRLTATGREILLALDNGYKIFINKGEIMESITGGILLQPDNPKKRQGILPTDIPEIDANRLFGTFPLPKEAIGNPINVGTSLFPKEVSQQVAISIDEQTRAAKKNFDALVQLFINKDKEVAKYEQKYTTCINMLTPDSHVIPYDRQAEYREQMAKYLLDKAYLSKLGKSNQKRLPELIEVIKEILEKAEKKSGKL